MLLNVKKIDYPRKSLVFPSLNISCLYILKSTWPDGKCCLLHAFHPGLTWGRHICCALYVGGFAVGFGSWAYFMQIVLQYQDKRRNE